MVQHVTVSVGKTKELKNQSAGWQILTHWGFSLISPFPSLHTVSQGSWPFGNIFHLYSPVRHVLELWLVFNRSQLPWPLTTHSENLISACQTQTPGKGLDPKADSAGWSRFCAIRWQKWPACQFTAGKQVQEGWRKEVQKHKEHKKKGALGTAANTLNAEHQEGQVDEDQVKLIRVEGKKNKEVWSDPSHKRKAI